MAGEIGRKLAAILVSDVVGYSRLAGRDEELTLARLRALRSDLIDPIVSVHRGRVVKRTGDGAIVEFRSVVDAVRCAIEVQTALVERNAGLPPERKIEFRIGIHLGDVMEEADGDLMGDGVNIAARLETICAPGGVCLSEDAYRQVRNRLDLAVTDLGDRELKNIADPVRVYALTVGQAATARAAATQGTSQNKGATPAKAGVHRADAATATTMDPGFRRGGKGRLAGALAGIATVIVLAAVAAWYFLQPSPPVGGEDRVRGAAAAHLSIVVLPFANLSNDPKQDYFADGITDNLTTDLSRIRNSFVIARNTAFTYKGKNVDAKEIGKDLGVRYVLEGSVQRDGNRVRVNAQLIDAESGAHLWADRFEEDLADLFKLQDDVVARLANALRVELANAESRMSYLERKQSPDAIDLSMRGWAIVWQQPKKDTNLAARDFFEQALRIDSDNDNALAGIAVTYMREHAYGWIDPKINYDDKVVTPADRAIAINPNNAMAYYAKGLYLGETRRPEEALTVAETGLRNNPNFAPLYFTRAYASIGLGRSEQTKADLQHAMRLSPRDPQTGIWYSLLGGADIQLGHYEAAIDDDRKSIDSGYRVFLPYADLAAAYALAGKIDEAKAALAEARKLNPRLTMKWYSARGPNTPMVYEGLRKAGLPEDEPAPPTKHLSIVVLPFDNLSGDPKQDYFADGITDNLTTDLSRIRNSFVIARNTAFTYKGKSVDAKEIGKELGVRYVLEGSVARDGNRVRVNAQLIDAESGSHLWADRFEEDLADLFKLQDDVVARLASALGYELVKAEAEKGAHSNNPDAIDLTMQGMALVVGNLRDRTRYARAHELFERALKIDPANADAVAGEARFYQAEFADGLGGANADYDSKIISLADRAIGLNPGVVWAYAAKSTYFFLSRRAKESLEVANAGIAVNPNFAPLYMARRGAEISLGQFKQAADDVRHAMQLSPRDPEMALWHMQMAAVQFGLENFDNTIEEANKSIDGGYHEFQPYTYLAAVYALTGRQEEARAALAEAQRLNPRLTSMKWLLSHSPNMPRYFEGMRKAGLPEDEPPPPPKHLSIVVLPFDNLSGDPKQDYFADGITDNLTTDLSRIRNSFVIARNTAFTYKGKSVDAKEIGKELGVRYVLEGSVARDGNRVRVNAQLIDAESGAHLWADRFEEDLADLFKLQDDVVARLANTLGYELTKAEAEKGAHSSNPDAIDLTMRGWALYQLYLQQPTKDKNRAARDAFEQALKVDPDNADALVGKARTYLGDYAFGWKTEGIDYEAQILAASDRALALAPDNFVAYYVKCTYLYLSHRAGESLGAADAGLRINPSYASLYAARLGAEMSLGRFEQAKADIERAMQLSPRDPAMGQWDQYLGSVELESGHFEAAIGELRKSIDAGYRPFVPYMILAAAYAQAGKMEEAKSTLADAQRLNPRLTVKDQIEHGPNVPVMIDGLRKAGLPEEEGPRLSIVVLPFQNLSGDAKQDYLADVLTDELTTYISRIPGSFVIARNTAFTYKDKPTDAREIGKDLGVRYALEGSVQPTDKRIRTNAQLIDTETGAHLWAEEFDTDKTDLLETEDDIVTRLARTLQIQLAEVETARMRQTLSANADAQELAMRCQVSGWRAANFKEVEAAHRLCEQALKLDPNSVFALADLANELVYRVANVQSTDRTADIARADELVSRALAIDSQSPEAHRAKSGVLGERYRFAEARDEAARAIAINPAYMDGYIALCFAAYGEGNPDKVMSCADDFMRLSPRDPLLWSVYLYKGVGYFMAKKDAEALDWLRRSIALYPNFQATHIILIATLASLGKDDEAHGALTRYLSLPGTHTRTIAAYRKQSNSDTAAYLAMRERVYAGLRKAGMPER